MFKKIGYIFFLCFVFTIKAKSQSREELQKQQQQILKELNDLNNDLAAIRNNKKAALGAYAVVQNKIAKRESLINSINKDMRIIDEDIYKNELEIYRLKKELDTLKLQYAKSLIFAYKNRGSSDYLNFLFSAKNFNDALKRMNYLKSYRKFRETQAETIAQTQNLVQSKTVLLNNNKSEKSNALQTQSSQLKVLEEDKQEKTQVVKQLKDQEKDIAAQLKQREKDKIKIKKAIDAAIKRALEEAERQARLAKVKAAEEEKKRIAQQKEDARLRDIEAKNNARNNIPEKPTPKPSVKPDENVGTVTSANKSERVYTDFESTKAGLTLSLNFEGNKGRLPWPIDGGTIIGHFGKEQYGDTRLKADNDGIFIKTSVGANVKCVADGEVMGVFVFDDFQAVMVLHGKYSSTYIKLNSVSVKKGDMVKAGTPLGKVAADFDGEGQFEFQVMNIAKKQFQNPELWLKRR